MSNGPAVELSVGASQIETHPLFKKQWPEATNVMIHEEMSEEFEDIQGLMQKEITPTMAVGATKDLKNSYKGFPITGRGIDIQGIWGTPVKYGAWHEYGTGPHFPPVAPLMPWIIAKGTFTDATGAPISASSPEYIVRSMAFLIARAISRRGTIPGNEVEQWFMKNEVKVTRRIMNKLNDLLIKATAA